ncbi:MAG: hypothetical protein V3U57_05035 [Robiginitomaculum sp.]
MPDLSNTETVHLATHLAKGGATTYDIQAVLDHKTLSESQQYVRFVNKAVLADEAFKFL